MASEQNIPISGDFYVGYFYTRMLTEGELTNANGRHFFLMLLCHIHMDNSLKELFTLTGIRQNELIIHFSVYLRDIFKGFL